MSKHGLGEVPMAGLGRLLRLPSQRYPDVAQKPLLLRVAVEEFPADFPPPLLRCHPSPAAVVRTQYPAQWRAHQHGSSELTIPGVRSAYA